MNKYIYILLHGDYITACLTKEEVIKEYRSWQKTKKVFPPQANVELRIFQINTKTGCTESSSPPLSMFGLDEEDDH